MCVWFVAAQVSRPVLVIYFLMLFVQAAKRQLDHMIRYKYVPCSFGRARKVGAHDARAVAV